MVNDDWIYSLYVKEIILKQDKSKSKNSDNEVYHLKKTRQRKRQ